MYSYLVATADIMVCSQPGLKSNNLLDTYEYPDFPMATGVYGVQPVSIAIVQTYTADSDLSIRLP